MNVTLIDSDNPLNLDHFAIEFKTRNSNQINFSILVLNRKVKLVEFMEGQKKSPLLSFRIDGLK